MAKTPKPGKKASSKTSKTKAKAKKAKAPKKAAKPRKAAARKKPTTRLARRKKTAKKPVRKTAKKPLKKAPKKVVKKKVAKAKAKPKAAKARKPAAKKATAKPKSAKPKVAKPTAAPKPKPIPATKPMAIPPPRPIPPPPPRPVAAAPAPAPMTAPAAPPVKELKVGDMAPDLRLPAENDQMVAISDFRGKKVVLYFYSKDDTPGCTMEACSFRDGLEAIRAKGAVVLGVSIDPVLSHQRFREKYNLNFPLLSDRDKKAVEAFGVWKERSMYGQTFMGTERTTFIIDENGRIAKIFPKVKVEGHFEEVLNSL